MTAPPRTTVQRRDATGCNPALHKNRTPRARRFFPDGAGCHRLFAAQSSAPAAWRKGQRPYRPPAHDAGRDPARQRPDTDSSAAHQRRDSPTPTHPRGRRALFPNGSGALPPTGSSRPAGCRARWASPDSASDIQTLNRSRTSVRFRSQWW
ncbi:hypothetical protein D3C72_420080 [compost metagenome]